MEEDKNIAQASGAWHIFGEGLYPALIRILTSLLIVVLCAWMLVGGINMVWALGNAFGSGWASAAERTIMNSLILLALLEVIRTLQCLPQTRASTRDFHPRNFAHHHRPLFTRGRYATIGNGRIVTSLS